MITVLNDASHVSCWRLASMTCYHALLLLLVRGEAKPSRILYTRLSFEPDWHAGCIIAKFSYGIGMGKGNRCYVTSPGKRNMGFVDCCVREKMIACAFMIHTEIPNPPVSDASLGIIFSLSTWYSINLKISYISLPRPFFFCSKKM